MALSVHSVTQSMCEWDMVAPLEVITAYNFANSPKSSGGYESLVIFSTCSLEVCCFQHISVSSKFSILILVCYV
jgi:hypothetical protein